MLQPAALLRGPLGPCARLSEAAQNLASCGIKFMNWQPKLQAFMDMLYTMGTKNILKTSLIGLQKKKSIQSRCPEQHLKDFD